MEKSYAVVGVGNPLLCDDASGLKVVEVLQRNYGTVFPQVEFKFNYCGGLDLLEDIEGYRGVILVDALCTGDYTPGECVECVWAPLPRIPVLHLAGSHGVTFHDTIETGKLLGLQIPEEIVIFGIEGADFETFSTDCTPPVTARIEEAAACIAGRLDGWMKSNKNSEPVQSLTYGRKEA